MTLAILGALLGAALTAALLSVLLEWAGIALGWWSGTHSRDLLMTERGYVEAIDDYPLSPLRPTQLTAHGLGSGRPRFVPLSASPGRRACMGWRRSTP